MLYHNKNKSGKHLLKLCNKVVHICDNVIQKPMSIIIYNQRYVQLLHANILYNQGRIWAQLS